jgi:hypothetical protein
MAVVAATRSVINYSFIQKKIIAHGIFPLVVMSYKITPYPAV